MSKITKEQVLENIEEVKKYIQEAETPKEEKKVGVAIYTRLGNLIFQSSKSTIKEAIIEKGNANFSDADLRGANLRDADLSDADLSGANLRDADLSDADLSGADLSGANLRDADLSGADLSDADLSGADLRDAELNCAKFYGRGGTKKLTKKQLPDFLNALGFQIID